MLESWLEQRVNVGNQEASTHNAIGKIYITLNKKPQEWLLNNRCYDPKVIGKFCEKFDPYLAYIAYRRAWGECDEELIKVTNENGLLKDQARYLVERQDLELWTKVLQDENEYKEQLVDEVVSTALPEADNPDMVSTTVKAFMNANLPHQLIGLLERLVLQDTIFAENRNLQNLLILTAIKAAPDRVKEFIHRMDKFDGPEIANIALGDQYKLYEEAFAIYKKFDHHQKAIGVLLDYLNDLERAEEYAQRADESEVWSLLAKKQLEENDPSKAIACYIVVDDASNYSAIIAAVKADGSCFEDLVSYSRWQKRRSRNPRLILNSSLRLPSVIVSVISRSSWRVPTLPRFRQWEISSTTMLNGRQPRFSTPPSATTRSLRHVTYTSTSSERPWMLPERQAAYSLGRKSPRHVSPMPSSVLPRRVVFTLS